MQIIQIISHITDRIIYNWNQTYLCQQANKQGKVLTMLIYMVPLPSGNIASQSTTSVKIKIHIFKLKY